MRKWVSFNKTLYINESFFVHTKGEEAIGEHKKLEKSRIQKFV